MADRKFAIVTGASTGIGVELAHLAAENGYDLLIAADEPFIEASAADLRGHGGAVEAIVADLATIDGNDRLLAAAGDRPVDALFANAGRGLGHALIEQDVAEWRHVIDTNIVGTTYLLQKVAQRMAARGEGRILITGSIAGFIPGTYQAVYNASKAYLDNLSYALRAELKDKGVTVTCLMPGPTETEFFDRAHMLDTKVGQQEKDDPAKVARIGFKAMMRGDGHVVAGLSNKLQVAAAHVSPPGLLAEQHRLLAQPRGSEAQAKGGKGRYAAAGVALALLGGLAASSALNRSSRQHHQRVPT